MDGLLLQMYCVLLKVLFHLKKNRKNVLALSDLSKGSSAMHLTLHCHLGLLLNYKDLTLLLLWQLQIWSSIQKSFNDLHSYNLTVYLWMSKNSVPSRNQHPVNCEKWRLSMLSGLRIMDFWLQDNTRLMASNGSASWYILTSFLFV